MKSRPLKSEAKKVRVADGVYSRLEQMADEGRKEGVSITGLTEQALKQFFERFDTGAVEPGLTPMTPEETELIRMVLAVSRHPYDRAEQIALKMLRELFENRQKSG